MSSPILPEVGEVTTRGLGLRARVAVLLAFAVCSRSPRFVQRFLRLLGKGARRPEFADLLRYRRAVVGVSRYCAGEGCLPRSVATLILARSYGHTGTWKTGLRQDPFLAHAWVELDGQMVGEPDSVRLLRTVLTVQPSFAGELERTAT